MSDNLDPVYRCDSCQRLLRLETIHKTGCCSKCGNKRVRNVTVLNEEEIQQLKDWGLESFAAEFKGVEDEPPENDGPKGNTPLTSKEEAETEFQHGRDAIGGESDYSWDCYSEEVPDD